MGKGEQDKHVFVRHSVVQYVERDSVVKEPRFPRNSLSGVEKPCSCGLMEAACRKVQKRLAIDLLTLYNLESRLLNSLK